MRCRCRIVLQKKRRYGSRWNKEKCISVQSDFQNAGSDFEPFAARFSFYSGQILLY